MGFLTKKHPVEIFEYIYENPLLRSISLSSTKIINTIYLQLYIHYCFKNRENILVCFC